MTKVTHREYDDFFFYVAKYGLYVYIYITCLL